MKAFFSSNMSCCISPVYPWQTRSAACLRFLTKRSSRVLGTPSSTGRKLLLSLLRLPLTWAVVIWWGMRQCRKEKIIIIIIIIIFFFFIIIKLPTRVLIGWWRWTAMISIRAMMTTLSWRRRDLWLLMMMLVVEVDLASILPFTITTAASRHI